MDFSNRQNRFIRLHEVSDEYLAVITQKTRSDPYYPTYHVAPKHGLLNDPNGLSYFNGEHHIFYQWFPLGPVHGLKHWYHVSTTDFYTFKDRGVALYPEQDYEQHGCYSGVGVVEGDELNLLYTANYLPSAETGHPTQALAVLKKDGNIEKKGVVIEFNSEHYTHNFRDPVSFKRNSDYFMIIGAESKEHQGKLALYSGKAINQYQYRGNIDIGLSDFGYMWECPNYYEEQGKGVLLFSPQGVTSDNKYDLKNIFSVVYIVGKPIDTKNLVFENDGYYELDKGFDFYAPQTYCDHLGRRILIGWLGNSKSEYPTDKNFWAHMLTLPRQLTIEDNKLLQQPLAEINELRSKTVDLASSHKLESIAFELELMVDQEFKIEFKNEVGDQMLFSGDQSEYVLDRSLVSDLHAESFGTVRFAKRQVEDKEKEKIRIFVDHSSIEIFCAKGSTVFTSRIFVKNLSDVSLHGTTGFIHYLRPIKYV